MQFENYKTEDINNRFLLLNKEFIKENYSDYYIETLEKCEEETNKIIENIDKDYQNFFFKVEKDNVYQGEAICHVLGQLNEFKLVKIAILLVDEEKMQGVIIPFVNHLFRKMNVLKIVVFINETDIKAKNSYESCNFVYDSEKDGKLIYKMTKRTWPYEY